MADCSHILNNSLVVHPKIYICFIYCLLCQNIAYVLNLLRLPVIDFADIDQTLMELILFVEKTTPLNSFENFVRNTWVGCTVVNPKHCCHYQKYKV